MEDRDIVELYLARDEEAIEETEVKYGKYLYSIARGIVGVHEDAEECVSDTYVGAWNSIPPHEPNVLSTFLGKITRRLSLKKVRETGAEKRGGGEVPAALDELSEIIPGESDAESELFAKELAAKVNAFLKTLPESERRVFLCRYWYLDSVKSIAARFGWSESKVKMTLKRARDKLRDHLEKEGFI